MMFGIGVGSVIKPIGLKNSPPCFEVCDSQSDE
jgi:hypothetical protein